MESRPKMPSKAIPAMQAKRGATSMAARTPETLEKEVTSRAKEVLVVILESEVGADKSELSLRDCKRHSKDGEGHSRPPHQKKPKEFVSLVADVVVAAKASYREEVKRLKGRLDQVCS